MPVEDVAGLAVEACYNADSAQALRDLLARILPEGFVVTLELELAGAGGRAIRTIGRCRKVTKEGEPYFRVTKLSLGHLGQAHDEMRAENQLLGQIIAKAREAYWCIEFLEPVDISRGTDSIVRQIFENRSIWRIANPAMQALYHLPGTGEFRAFDVHLYWPHTPENEAFVRQIIESDYHIDAAISYDRRYDGTVIIMENDVRADIQDGYLYRIWGNGRVAGTPAAGMAQASDIFSHFPDPVLMLDESGAELMRNEAAAAAFTAPQPDAMLLRRILAHAAKDKPRRLWTIPIAEGGKGLFMATTHRLHDETHGPVTLLLLQQAPASR
jgi:PAS domain-containing protein